MSGEVEAVMTDNARIERAADDWVRDEMDECGKFLAAHFYERTHKAFVDSAYWMIDEIKAGRIKVNIK